MTKRLINFRIDEDLIERLQRIRERDGVPVAEQVRRAIVDWLEVAEVKPERKRAATRKRS